MYISHKIPKMRMNGKHGFLQRVIQGLTDACYIWRQEMKLNVKDEGVLMFVILVPLAYPLLYSWIYNNELVHEVPVAVVDESHSALSREFARQCDASPDVFIKAYVNDMREARRMMERQEVSGIYRIPHDFSTNVNSMRQATVAVYCDMSLMLNYKAVFQTAQAVSTEMGKKIQISISGNYTHREDEISTQPLDFDEIPLFNPSGGYGSFILPAVLMLIIQQTLLLGIGLSAGTARENNRFTDLIPVSRHYHGIFRIVLGKSMCYLMIYSVVAAYLSVVVPRIFNFPALGQAGDLFAVLFPYVLSCIFFGLTLSCLIRYRENVMLLVVFTSVPLMFLSGVSWPQSSISGVWQAISYVFPSTNGVRAFVRINSMGGTLSDVMPEYRALWIQAAIYFFLACIVFRYQIMRLRSHILQRLAYIRRKRNIRRKLRARVRL